MWNHMDEHSGWASILKGGRRRQERRSVECNVIRICLLFLALKMEEGGYESGVLMATTCWKRQESESFSRASRKKHCLAGNYL